MVVAMHKSVLRTIKAITQKKFHMSGKDGTGKNLRELSLHTVKRMVKGKINSENWPVSKSTVKHHLHNNTLFGSVTRKKFLGASHKMECQASPSIIGTTTGMVFCSYESKIYIFGHAHHQHVWRQEGAAY